MRKWVIIGGIIGITNSIVVIPILSHLIDLLGGPFSKWGRPLDAVGMMLFPTGILTMDIDPNSSPYFFWSIYIIAVILNIGLFIFLSLTMRKICLFMKSLRRTS